jgi:putative membrane protein
MKPAVCLYNGFFERLKKVRTMLWVKAFHVISMVTWFAGLFYLPRLYVYHAMSDDAPSIARFKIMERKLFWGIMTPSALFTVGLGLALWLHYGIGRGGEGVTGQGWMHAKLGIVALLVIYHIYLGYLLKQFKYDLNTHSHVFYRWINELPVLALFAAVILVIVKPF